MVLSHRSFSFSINVWVAQSTPFCSGFWYSVCSVSAFRLSEELLPSYYRTYEAPCDTFPITTVHLTVRARVPVRSEYRVSSLRAVQVSHTYCCERLYARTQHVPEILRRRGMRGRFHTLTTYYSVFICALGVAGPVPGIDRELPEPEKVANAFGDNNLKVNEVPVYRYDIN